MQQARLIAVTVAALFSATPVVAADMPVKARGPAIVPVYNWTGFYAGVNLGWGWDSGSGTITLGGATGPYSGSGNGVLGGVQAGDNYQVRAMVLGVETDIQGSGARGTVTGTAGAATITGTAKVPAFGTIRGRLGYAADRWMLYATGGAVYGWSKLD